MLYWIFRYELMSSCWKENPLMRPKFSKIASQLKSFLREVKVINMIVSKRYSPLPVVSPLVIIHIWAYIRQQVCPFSASQYICSTSLSVHPFIRPSIHPFIRPSIHPFIRSSIHPFIRSSIHPFIRSSIHPFIYSFNYPFIHPESIHYIPSLPFPDFTPNLILIHIQPLLTILFNLLQSQGLIRYSSNSLQKTYINITEDSNEEV